jgi:hypothetical protein
MAEQLNIPFTPETETTEERYFWDGFIRSMDRLAGIVDAAPEEHDPIDLVEILKDMGETEDEEDALTLVYNYAAQLTTPPEQSSDLVFVHDFLAQNGFVEFERETE